MLEKDFYIKNGLIYGVISIIYLMITYVLGLEVIVSGWNTIGQLILFFGVFYYFGIQARDGVGGYISFSKVFKTLFISLALSTFIFILFYFILYTIIDPGLMGRQMDFDFEVSLIEMENKGASEAEIDQAIQVLEMIKGFIGKLFSIGGFLLIYSFSLFFGAIGLTIIAGIVKKNNPNPFAENENTSHE